MTVECGAEHQLWYDIRHVPIEERYVNTYILKNWGADRKVTVDEDVIVSADRGSRSEALTVQFYNQDARSYERTLIAAFDNVQSVFLEGTDIQVLVDDTKDLDKCVEKHPTKQVWIDIPIGANNNNSPSCATSR